MTTHTYTFDLKLFAQIDVSARDEATARAMLKTAIEENTANLGAWPNGDPIVCQLSLDDDAPDLTEIDGADPEDAPKSPAGWDKVEGGESAESVLARAAAQGLAFVHASIDTCVFLNGDTIGNIRVVEVGPQLGFQFESINRLRGDIFPTLLEAQASLIMP